MIFGELIPRKIKITAKEKQSPEQSYSSKEIVEMLDKGPLLEIYNTSFYTAHGIYVKVWIYKNRIFSVEY